MLKTNKKDTNNYYFYGGGEEVEIRFLYHKVSEIKWIFNAKLNEIWFKIEQNLVQNYMVSTLQFGEKLNENLVQNRSKVKVYLNITVIK